MIEEIEDINLDCEKLERLIEERKGKVDKLFKGLRIEECS